MSTIYSNFGLSKSIYFTTMQEGTVKFFNETKGFGFISPSNGGKDIFVHVSGLIDEIRENDKVTFEVQNGKKGLNATKVKVI
jgi:CspA family cold shock protein